MVAELDGRKIAMAFLDSFGTRSPVGDAGRVKRWLATGESGHVAGSARRYQARRGREYARRSGPPPAPHSPAQSLDEQLRADRGQH
jgi:D-alanyl-D-alanine endopeptidase (penicillin-binding protein 7)